MHTDVIAQFDRAMDLYMSARFGGDNAWRVACHRAAKIAGAALEGILPSVPVKAVLVELVAYMDGGTSFVHTWCIDSGSPGLNVGYLVRDDGLPSGVRAQLMNRDTVRVHAGQVRAAYASMMVAA